MAVVYKSMSKKSKYKPRNKEKYAALNTNRQVGNRKEYLHCDYVEKLNDKEKEFLNSFLEETVIANFKHKGKRIIKSRKEELKIYVENNARNRCTLSKARVTGMLDDVELTDDTRKNIDRASDVEDGLIVQLSLRNKGYIDL